MAVLVRVWLGEYQVGPTILHTLLLKYPSIEKSVMTRRLRGEFELDKHNTSSFSYYYIHSPKAIFKSLQEAPSSCPIPTHDPLRMPVLIPAKNARVRSSLMDQPVPSTTHHKCISISYGLPRTQCALRSERARPPSSLKRSSRSSPPPHCPKASADSSSSHSHQSRACDA